MNTKLTKEQLKEVLQKAAKLAILESVAADTGLGKYSKKVNDLIEKVINDIDDLVEEGQDLMGKDTLKSVSVQERNHLVVGRIGILKGLKARLVNIIGHLHKNI